jgi:PAS domain S-box-containing protein
MKDKRLSHVGEKIPPAARDGVQASLDDVLITAELSRRPTRAPDYQAEGRALTGLAEAMADSPQTILQTLVETALDLCRADSAGISILERGGAAGVFRWHAVAGRFAANIGSYALREATPSGIVLDRDASLLFAYPERHFDYGRAIDPPIVEALLVPFHNEGKPVGTLWVIAHRPSRKFDNEDQRVLTSLSRFASMAYQLKTAALTAVTAREDVRQILNTAAIGLAHCSRDLRYLACNRAYEKIMGLSAEQIIGRPMIDVMGTKAFEVIRPYIERVLCGERVEFEEEVPISAGGPRCFHVVDEPWFDSEGQVTGWIASVLEITDLKQTTKALQDSEQRLRLAMSSGTIGVWDWDVINNRSTWSPELVEIYGVDPGSARAYQDFRSRVHPDDLAAMESERDAAIRNRTQFDLEFRIVRPSGEIRWLSARGCGYYDENGRVVRVVGNNIDVTERVKAKEALREREQRLGLALDASMAGVWTWDPFTNQSSWDDRLHAQYGFAPGAPRTFDTWISSIHEEDRPKVLAHLDDVLHRHRNEWNIVFRAVRLDGTIAWMHNVGRSDRDADGRVTRMNGINQDITERRHAEELFQARRDEERERVMHQQAEGALRRSHAELERSHAELEQRTLQLRRLASQLTLAEQTARRQLASTLHDGLQQLLFSAGITLDEVMRTNPYDDQVDLLQRARADVKEAVQAARTLSVNLFPPVLHVGGLPAALSWLAKRTQDQYGIVVNVTADPQANPEASDVRILLFEGVRELLFNAVKHAGVDRVDVNLALGPGDTIHIQVSDDGVGFDPDATLNAKNQRHVGLGLFSIQERFALLGGLLDIQSAPGKGSRFILTLPRTGLMRPAADGTEAQRRDTSMQERLVYQSGGGTSKSLRILIVDDHPVARAGLRELFNTRPALHVVGEAADGVDAISQAMALHPDVVVMDVSLPQMNGVDATRRIHATLPHIQIVGFSTHDDEATERLMRKAGAEVYFTKNVGTDRLLHYLLSLIGQAKGAATS